MARFTHGTHDSQRVLSFEGPLHPPDKRTPRNLYALHIGKIARLVLTLDEVRDLRDMLNDERIALKIALSETPDIHE